MRYSESRTRLDKRNAEADRVPVSPVPADDVAFLAVADLHLSHKPPISRSAEEDWYEAMRRSLRQLKQMATSFACPVLMAGDIFDDGWRMHKVPPELINFAIKEFPDLVYAVPGNHDLPYHRLDQLHKSAFWTLVEAGKVRFLAPGESSDASSGRLWGFPLNCPLEPPKTSHSLCLSIAVAHAYIWKRGYGIPGASEDTSTTAYHRVLKGYDVAVFGDNHKPFTVTIKRPGGYKTRIVNCGGFLRRTSDEINHQPVVSLIYKSGEVAQRPLDTKQDKFMDKEEVGSTHLLGEKAEEFLTRLRSLRDTKINVASAMEHYFRENNINPRVQEIILTAMDKG